MFRFLATLLIMTSFSLQAQCSPLPVRVWQLHDYDMDHIKRLVELADESHIERIQLSHDIVMDAWQPIVQKDRAADINQICTWAHDRGIAVDMWTHELDGIPEELQKSGKADLEDPKLWEFIEKRYETLFEVCPDLDGLVLTMHETAMSIYADDKVESDKTPEERVAHLIDSMAEVCEKFDKDLYVRTFSYEPDELGYIQGGLKLCDSDITVMTKCVPHDWQPYYPYNPTIGNVGDHPQIIEFDLGQEYTGLSNVPYIELDYLKRHLDYDISKGASGAVLRVERLAWRTIDTPNQANIDIMSKMLLNPDLDPHQHYMYWLEDKYGKDAAPYLKSAFMRTFDIVNKTLFVRGFWISRHSLLPEYDYAMDHLHWLTTAKWDPSYKETEQELFNITHESLSAIIAEKDEALALIDESLADIELAKPYLDKQAYSELRDTFERQKAQTQVWKAAMQVIFGINLFKETRDEFDASFLRSSANALDILAEENRAHLIALAADYKKPERDDNYETAKRLVSLAYAVIEDPDMPVRKD